MMTVYVLQNNNIQKYYYFVVAHNKPQYYSVYGTTYGKWLFAKYINTVYFLPLWNVEWSGEWRDTQDLHRIYAQYKIYKIVLLFCACCALFPNK